MAPITTPNTKFAFLQRQLEQKKALMETACVPPEGHSIWEGTLEGAKWGAGLGAAGNGLMTKSWKQVVVGAVAGAIAGAVLKGVLNRESQSSERDLRCNQATIDALLAKRNLDTFGNE